MFLLFAGTLPILMGLGTGAIPVPLELESSANILVPMKYGQRDMYDIVWSCLTTIFACTWLAIHPNIPAARDSWWKINRRRARIMFWTLIAPEMVMWWAMRQASGARRIKEKYKGRGWTTTHGFFVQMGGFTLFLEHQEVGVLSLEKLEELFQRGEIDWPTVSEEDILDKSKGDALSKGLVACQVFWFVAQCIARAGQNLNVTELELVTLGFAVLNGITYFLWWNKPLDVRCPVAVQWHPRSEPIAQHDFCPSPTMVESPTTQEFGGDENTVSGAIFEVGLGSANAENGVYNDKARDDDESTILAEPRSPHNKDIPNLRHLSIPPIAHCSNNTVVCEPDNISDYVRRATADLCTAIVTVPPAVIRGIGDDFRAKGITSTCYDRLVQRPITALLRPLGDLSQSETIEWNAPRVPTFYAIELIIEGGVGKEHPLPENARWVSSFAIPVAIIHFMADVSVFPTNTEKVLWRLASIFTSLLPTLFVLLAPVISRGSTTGGPLKFHQGMGITRAFLVFGVMIYILSRLTLLSQSLVVLRALPAGAFETLPWTNFLPHL